MKQVSEAFKQAIKQYGRQIDVIIEYNENGIDKMLDVNQIFSVTSIVNSNLLKSVMKQLDFESSVKVSKGTWINVRFGVLVNEGITVQEVHQMRVDRLNSTQVKMLQGFEYVDFGKYLVTEEPEYNPNTFSYTHKCFDKMIFSMKEYEPLAINYPITLKDFLKYIARKINLKLEKTNFYNEEKIIQQELYKDLEYTYRDVLDEIAQATGSIICINKKGNLEVKYVNQTNENIDEDYFKDVDVSFKEKYGKINSIVLSRSSGTDNVYLRDEQSVQENGLCEIKISDNQIMNFNDRSEYLQGILNALDNIEYYIVDLKSTGITYLELGDLYNIVAGGNVYPCLMLNDEIDITQGLEEQIYTEMPEQSQTDYTKADKTDQKINQTNLIIDKQAQRINATITRVEQEEVKTSRLEISVDGISSEVSRKVGNDEIISRINQSPEAIEINANRIDLKANDVLNILSDNTINLSSKNIKIASDNFTVDESGNMTCTNANISGTVNATDGSFSGTINATSGTFNGTVNATSGSFNGTVTATSGTFDNCTVRDNCNVAGNSISSSTSQRINNLYVSDLDAVALGADSISLNNEFQSYNIGNYTGQTTTIPVLTSLTVDLNNQITAQTWKRLVFKGGILVQVQNIQ